MGAAPVSSATSKQRSFWAKVRRRTFEFHHPMQTAPVTFKAYTEARAWKKVRSFVIARMFGPWALTYGPDAVNRVMRDITCREITR